MTCRKDTLRYNDNFGISSITRQAAMAEKEEVLEKVRQQCAKITEERRAFAERLRWQLAREVNSGRSSHLLCCGKES